MLSVDEKMVAALARAHDEGRLEDKFTQFAKPRLRFQDAHLRNVMDNEPDQSDPDGIAHRRMCG